MNVIRRVSHDELKTSAVTLAQTSHERIGPCQKLSTLNHRLAFDRCMSVWRGMLTLLETRDQNRIARQFGLPIDSGAHR